MLSNQQFHHQHYTAARPTAPFELMTVTSAPVETEEFQSRMRRVGQLLRAAGVEAIYLVHGTFAGNDALGIARLISHVAPQAAPWLERRTKKAVDYVMRDCSNYTQRYAELFEQSVNQGAATRIPVRLFTWTSANHHLGRADCAIRLIDELQSQFTGSPSRVLLWGHSHAGNAFALMSNLLGAVDAQRDHFFKAARSYFTLRRLQEEVWWRVKKLLQSTGNPLSPLQIDIVTFGTPIRYGWDSTVCKGLLHYVFHRPAETLPEYLAKFPSSMAEVLCASGGDYIHQLGIANTNFQPNLLNWRSWLANRRLARMLQGEYVPSDLYGHLRVGMRVAEQGKTLLVDYGEPNNTIYRHAAGHSIYTQLEWLLFHAEDVSQRLYIRNEQV